MEKDEFFLQSNFTEEWIDLDIINSEVLEELKKIDREESVFHDEHQRWRAFTKFLDRNKTLSPEIMRALYKIGSNDPDKMMGGAMMRKLLDRKDCPMDLLEIASQSDENFLVKAANEAILRRNQNS